MKLTFTRVSKALVVMIALLFFSTGASFSLADSTTSGAGSALSMNWSGYQASSGNYTSISGSWTVPSVTGSTPSGDAAWIGIGGVTSSDLIQTGTLEVIDTTHQGQPQYSAWYELLPAGTVSIPLTISPGNSMSASISEQSPNTWLISMRDNTTGQSYQTTVNYTSSLSSSEWIEEMPTVSNGTENSFLSLDNFGTVSFTGATATENGTTISLGSAGAQPLDIVTTNNQALAVPSSIGTDGESFSVNRTSASSDSSDTLSSISPRSFNPGGRRFRTGIGTGFGTGSGVVIRRFFQGQGGGFSQTFTSSGSSSVVTNPTNIGSGRTLTMPFGNGTVTIQFGNY